MDANELTAISTKIWERINTYENECKTKSEQIDIIKKDILIFAHEQRRIGRALVVKEMDDKIEALKRLY